MNKKDLKKVAPWFFYAQAIKIITNGIILKFGWNYFVQGYFNTSRLSCSQAMAIAFIVSILTSQVSATPTLKKLNLSKKKEDWLLSPLAISLVKFAVAVPTFVILNQTNKIGTVSGLSPVSLATGKFLR